VGHCLKIVTSNNAPGAKLLIQDQMVIPLFVLNRTQLHKHCLLTKAQDEQRFLNWVLIN